MTRAETFRLSPRVLLTKGDRVKLAGRKKGSRHTLAVFEYAEANENGPYLCVRTMLPVKKNGLVIGSAFGGYRFVRPDRVKRDR